MSAEGEKLRKVEGGYEHWCPGCESMHVFPVPRWTFDGDMEFPSFMPSMHYVGFCHYFLTDGQLRFCRDCKHELALQVVRLPNIPEGE